MRTANDRELAADAVVHALGVALGVPAAIAVVVIAALTGSAGDVATTAIYAACLVAMVGCSAAYNLLRTHRWRDWLQRFDHAAIFAMIAGTYTPFTLQLERAWAIGLTAAVWTVAGLGIVLKLWRPLRLGSVSVVFYLALGWIGLLALEPFFTSLATATLVLIGVGGAIYTAGVIFHLWHRLPYQNAIWHGFVLAAASVHYAAVLTTLGVA
jgi:hemolysin III